MTPPVSSPTPKEMADAIEKYAQWCGGAHDQGCPEDDTCSCSGKWVNDGVTAAVNYLRAQPDLIAALRSLRDACVRADSIEELPADIDGTLLDAATRALAIAGGSPEERQP